MSLLLYRQLKYINNKNCCAIKYLVLVNSARFSKYSKQNITKLKQYYCSSWFKKSFELQPALKNTFTQHTLSNRYLSSFHRYTEAMDVPEGVFRGKLDRFSGTTVESKVEFAPDENFAQKLEKSLDHWFASNYRTIWFKVDTAHAVWIPVLTEHGFEFHHAKKGYVMLYRWLPTTETANLPDFAHTMMGVGGLVVNDNNEILVVSDRHAMIPDSWKLPGGYVDPKEDLVDAAIREVREETGIDCTFRSVINIRHSHGGSFNCSDVYMVIALKPLHLNLTRCEREIAKLQWMPVSEFLEHPHVHTTNRELMRTYLDYQQQGICITCEKATHPVLKKDYMIYRVQKANEQN